MKSVPSGDNANTERLSPPSEMNSPCSAVSVCVQTTSGVAVTGACLSSCRMPVRIGVDFFCRRDQLTGSVLLDAVSQHLD